MLLVLVTGLPATGKSTMAEAAADILGAPVLAHDWAMSGLRPYPEIQRALDAMDPPAIATSDGRSCGPWRAPSSGGVLPWCSTAWPATQR